MTDQQEEDREKTQKKHNLLTQTISFIALYYNHEYNRNQSTETPRALKKAKKA